MSIKYYSQDSPNMTYNRFKDRHKDGGDHG